MIFPESTLQKFTQLKITSIKRIFVQDIVDNDDEEMVTYKISCNLKLFLDTFLVNQK